MDVRMHQGKRAAVAAGIFTLVLVFGAIWWLALPACAYAGNSFAAVGLFGPARFETIRQAVQTRNYDAWRLLMEGRSIARQVTLQNFDEYAQAWVASIAGDQTLMNAFKHKYQLHSSCPFGGWNFTQSNVTQK